MMKLAVGAVIPDIPSVLVERNRDFATGITDSYVDVQDLYLEVLDTSDANRYMEETASKPFQKIVETIRIKVNGGYHEEELVIRLTGRGPVINDLLPRLDVKQPVTVSWSPLERMKGEIGLDYLLHAKSVEDLDQRLTKLDVISLNYVMTVSRAERLAESWGSELKLVENLGYIGSDSGGGSWDDGLRRINSFSCCLEHRPGYGIGRRD